MSAQHRHAIVLLTVDEVPAFLDQNPGRTVTIKAVKDPNGAAPESKPNGVMPRTTAPRQRTRRPEYDADTNRTTGGEHLIEQWRIKGPDLIWHWRDLSRLVVTASNGRIKLKSARSNLSKCVGGGLAIRVSRGHYRMTDKGKTETIENIRLILNTGKRL